MPKSTMGLKGDTDDIYDQNDEIVVVPEWLDDKIVGDG